MRKRTEMSKALKVLEQVIANNNRNDDLIEQLYFLCKEEAKQEVEERIIKLLENELSQEMSESAGYIMTEDNYPVRWADLIALIKGEQK